MFNLLNLLKYEIISPASGTLLSSCKWMLARVFLFQNFIPFENERIAMNFPYGVPLWWILSYFSFSFLSFFVEVIKNPWNINDKFWQYCIFAAVVLASSQMWRISATYCEDSPPQYMKNLLHGCDEGNMRVNDY